MSGWQPIETAPKNPAGTFVGPVVLVWCTADNLPWPAYWGPGGNDNAGCWTVADGGGDSSEMDEGDVTHWMPLPDPPEAP